MYRGLKMRRTKIVATIGPASRDPEVLFEMVRAGMDVARLDYSHGTLDEHADTVRLVREAAERAERPVAILQDLPGPKLRIGPLAGRHRGAQARRSRDLRLREDGIDRKRDPHDGSWRGLAESVEPGEIVYLANGSIRMRVNEVRTDVAEVEAEVEVAAPSPRAGPQPPGPTDSLPAVPAHDLELLRHGGSIGVDMVALSFVRRPEDIEEVRAHTACLIAKMEKPQAVERAEAIMKVADCVMVARGDLGIEMPIEQVPIVQKQLLKTAGWLARPSITATQMLDSMVSSARPPGPRWPTWPTRSSTGATP